VPEAWTGSSLTGAEGCGAAPRGVLHRRDVGQGCRQRHDCRSNAGWIDSSRRLIVECYAHAGMLSCWYTPAQAILLCFRDLMQAEPAQTYFCSQTHINQCGPRGFVYTSPTACSSALQNLPTCPEVSGVPLAASCCMVNATALPTWMHVPPRKPRNSSKAAVG
jgi:hypothetical protein